MRVILPLISGDCIEESAKMYPAGYTHLGGPRCQGARQAVAVRSMSSGGLLFSVDVSLGKLEWYGKTKYRADTGFAFCSDVSPHQFHELFADRQSQASPSIFSGRGTVGLDERLKQFAEGAGSNAYPIIDDGKPDMSHR